MGSLAGVFALASLFSLLVPKPDAIISLVVAWALLGVSSELREATRLLDPTKHNPVAWDRMVLDALETATSVLSLACLGLAVVGAALRVYRSANGATCLRAHVIKEEQSVATQEYDRSMPSPKSRSIDITRISKLFCGRLSRICTAV